jgi:hypothetical protein
MWFSSGAQRNVRCLAVSPIAFARPAACWPPLSPSAATIVSRSVRIPDLLMLPNTASLATRNAWMRRSLL